MKAAPGVPDYRQPVRKAARKALEWTIQRDILIRRAHASGISLRAIGADAGLSHTAIAKIVAK